MSETREDYQARHKAEIEEGLWCYQCGGMASSPLGKLTCGYRRLCYHCRKFNTSPEEVTDSKFVRCPKCRERWEGYELCSYEGLEDGEHEITCPGCEHEFTVTVATEFHFTSPALGTEPEGQPS